MFTVYQRACFLPPSPSALQPRGRATSCAGLFLGQLGAGYLTFASKDQELKVHFVEIAIGILRADPKEMLLCARLGARYHREELGVPFSQQDREALLRKPSSAKVALLGVWGDETGGYGGIEGVDGFPGLLGAMMKKEGFPVSWRISPRNKHPARGNKRRREAPSVYQFRDVHQRAHQEAHIS